MSRPEAEIVKAILDYLALRKDIAFVYRQNSGAVLAEHKGRQRFFAFTSMAGISDIVGMLSPSGRWLAIEVKREGASPTQAQQLFLDLVTSHGGIAFVARSVADVVGALGEAP